MNPQSGASRFRNHGHRDMASLAMVNEKETIFPEAVVSSGRRPFILRRPHPTSFVRDLPEASGSVFVDILVQSL